MGDLREIQNLYFNNQCIIEYVRLSQTTWDIIMYIQNSEHSLMRDIVLNFSESTIAESIKELGDKIYLVKMKLIKKFYKLFRGCSDYYHWVMSDCGWDLINNVDCELVSVIERWHCDDYQRALQQLKKNISKDRKSLLSFTGILPDKEDILSMQLSSKTLSLIMVMKGKCKIMLSDNYKCQGSDCNTCMLAKKRVNSLTTAEIQKCINEIRNKQK